MLLSLFPRLMRLFGWKYVNLIPSSVKSFVALGAPHTSNYDFFPGMGANYYLKGKFVIKSDWLKFPFGAIFKSMGAIGVNRELIKEGKVASSTDLLANLFKEYSDLKLLIAPEGTRSPVKEWKSGFYYIAQKAGVPIVLGFADYKKKEYGLGAIIYPTNFEDDMKKIMDFYRHIQGHTPKNFFLDHRFS